MAYEDFFFSSSLLWFNQWTKTPNYLWLSYTSTQELNAIKYMYAAQEQGDFSVSCLAVY